MTARGWIVLAAILGTVCMAQIAWEQRQTATTVAKFEFATECVKAGRFPRNHWFALQTCEVQ